MTANFVNEDVLHLRAARLAAPLAASVRERCARLIANELRRDPCNARPLCEAEWEIAPDWAKRALLAGRPPVVFRPDQRSLARMRRLVLRIAAAYTDFCNIPADASGLDGMQRAECVRLFDNIAHMNFDDLDEKTRALARRRRRIIMSRQLAADRLIRHFPEDAIIAGAGSIWRRVVSTGDLGMIGKRMRNCTAYDRASHGHYAGLLARDEAQFWVLETHRGEPMALAMFSTSSRALLEARLPRNAELPIDFPEIDALATARNYRRHRAPEFERVMRMEDDLIRIRQLRSVLAGRLLEPRRTT